MGWIYFFYIVLGVVYGIVKSGIGIVVMSVMWLEFIMKFIILVVMVGIIVIYGFVVVVFIGNGCEYIVIYFNLFCIDIVVFSFCSLFVINRSDGFFFFRINIFFLDGWSWV